MVPDAQRRQNRALSFQESPLRPHLRGRSLIRRRYRKLDPNILMMQPFEERHPPHQFDSDSRSRSNSGSDEIFSNDSQFKAVPPVFLFSLAGARMQVGHAAV
jgi:hypothetical protein